jgi:hypothetical protein
VAEKCFFGTDFTDDTDEKLGLENQSALIFQTIDPPAAEGKEA